MIFSTNAEVNADFLPAITIAGSTIENLKETKILVGVNYEEIVACVCVFLQLFVECQYLEDMSLTSDGTSQPLAAVGTALCL